jgi:hypothetical protein
MSWRAISGIWPCGVGSSTLPSGGAYKGGEGRLAEDYVRALGQRLFNGEPNRFRNLRAAVKQNKPLERPRTSPDDEHRKELVEEGVRDGFHAGEVDADPRVAREGRLDMLSQLLAGKAASQEGSVICK